MSNVIYIDANRANSFNQQGNTNEFTYKLNTELELPKGTQIQIQNTFINLKGITGGSMEITEDITETYSYFMYITEQAQFAPLGHFVDFNQSWYRSTLGVGISNFYGNFSTPATSEFKPNSTPNTMGPAYNWRYYKYATDSKTTTGIYTYS